MLSRCRSSAHIFSLQRLKPFRCSNGRCNNCKRLFQNTGVRQLSSQYCDNKQNEHSKSSTGQDGGGGQFYYIKPLVFSAVIVCLACEKKKNGDQSFLSLWVKLLSNISKNFGLEDLSSILKIPFFRLFLTQGTILDDSFLKLHLNSSKTEKIHKDRLAQNSTDASSQSTSSDTPTTLEELQEELIKQQIRFQREIEKLEKDNRELKKSLMLKDTNGLSRKKMKRSMIDMYSDVLDCLSDYDSTYNIQDQLPRVVVIGDQSSGKTSVLEMIVQARIFPRGSGEMMTRSPVQVTMSEGPYHVAKLRDDAKEYDLTKESELEGLRREIERRMKKSIKEGQSISNEVISLTVKGPGLQRMVLVDLPGIISTVTTDMASDTREKIKKICQQYMSNPNSIILCVQDGSLDAERSNVTDLVSSADPTGRRSIFVLTKVDLAESQLSNPDRIKQILEGKLFPMKAMGYFAVVTGKGNSNDSIQTIKDYEQKFFKGSHLFRGGMLRAHQMGTINMCMAVSQCFWRMVRESVEQQADAFKATKYNLETEWKNTFPRFREMDREELFEKARGDILDEVINLSQISPKQWEDLISKNLWNEMSNYVFESIYLPAGQSDSPGVFNTTIDIKLKQWAEKILYKKSLEIGQRTLEQEFFNLLISSSSSTATQSSVSATREEEDVNEDLKREIFEEIKKRRKWDAQAENSLRVIQMNTLEDRSVQDKHQWDEAVAFMKNSLMERKNQGQQVLEEMLGPSTWEKYLLWKSRSKEQSNRRVVKNELDKMFSGNMSHGTRLGREELIALRKNLESQSIEVDDDFIEETWHHLYRQQFFDKALSTATNCQKGFFYYQKGFQDNSIDCSDVVLFWRINRMLSATSRAIRQHIVNYETRRLEHDVKQILEEFSEDKDRLKVLLKGKRVELADEIKKVRNALDLLEEFIQELNKEKI